MRDSFRLPPRPTFVSILVMLAVSWLSVGIAAADEIDATAQNGGIDLATVENINVNVVNVEVYVTDKKGNRITGLTKDDFVLTVDDEPVAITNFYVVEDGSPQTEQPELLQPVESEPELPSRQPEVVERPEDQKLHLIVYIDNFNLRPFSRNRVIRATRQFLRANLRPGDEVMLVSYDRSLKVRHPFTKDPELIASALYELEDITGHRVHADSERQDMLDFIYNEERLEYYAASGRIRQYAESIYNDMAFTLDALRDQVDTLAGLPGRKAVLYVSDGLAMRSGEDLFYAVADRWKDQSSVLMDAQRFDMSRRFRSLTHQANTNRVTFYTIDAAGLRTYTYMDASNATPGGGAQIDSIHFSNMQAPLFYIAQETGGFAVTNTNNFLPGLEKMANDFGTYYSLGFVSAANESGRYHEIDVELKEDRRDVRLRFRQGFRDRSVGVRMIDNTLAALHYGYSKQDLGVELAVGRGQRQEDGQYLVPFVVKIPLGELTFLPQEKLHRARVTLYLAAKDTDGGLADVQDVPIPIDIPSADIERAKSQFYHYQLTLLMRPGRQMLAITVRDEIGAGVGVTTAGLTVGG
ncbi:MAG: VWA domain-containing protein [Acidobacteriota bacterium]